MSQTCLPEKVRISTGSAIAIGLLKGMLDVKPTTTYLLVCRKEKCSANCGFCPQARASKGRADRLSRVTWPPFPTEKVITGIEKTVKARKMKRVCFQTLNYPEAFDDVVCLVRQIKQRVEIPVSVSCKPLNLEKMKALADSGVNRISVALDAATENIFDKVKGWKIEGPYIWQKHIETLMEAVDVFGKGSVNTHLIAGLGETEQELCQTIQWCVDSRVYPSLFAFTPIAGTALEGRPPPSLNSYRRIQIAHYILTHRKVRIENIKFDNDGKLINFGISKEMLMEAVETGEPFRTSGCPGCNRPYYNERPSGPLYNYPRKLTLKEIKEIKRTLDG